MSETGEGVRPEETGGSAKTGVKEYLRSTVNYEAEQKHIDQSTSPLKGLLQRLHNARLTNAGIIDRLKSIGKK